MSTETPSADQDAATQTAGHADYRSFARTAPKVLEALLALGEAVDASGLEKPLTELVKFRVSQINGCAFCLQYHLDTARRHGVPQRKLDLVAGWRDAGIFTPRETAALAWAEALTACGEAAVPDAARAAMRQEFSETEGLFLTVATGTINAWNRIGVGLHLAPALPRAEAA